MRFLLLLLSALPFLWAELRFCHNGPHRIKETDCPGGFIAKKSINVTCAHYALTEVVPEGSTPQVVEDFCENITPVDLPIEGGEVSIKSLQEFTINLGDAAGAPAPLGNFTEKGVCQTECLIDWVEPGSALPEPHMEDKPSPNGTEPDLEVLDNEREVTKSIFMELLIGTQFEEDDPEGELESPYDPLWAEEGSNVTELRLIRLLAKSMQITWGSCKPYVEDTFLRQVLKSMIILTKMNKKSAVDIGLEEFKVISKLLDKCSNATNDAFELKGPNCDLYHQVDSIQYLKGEKGNWKYRSQARSFIWGMYEPITEAAWATVDFVHGYCFPFFKDNILHHHMYAIAMEALFPFDPVQKHWMNPINMTKGDAIWNSVLETGDIKISMSNLDACAIAGYAESPFEHRLERPFTTEELLADPTFTPVETEAKGWQKSLAQYWSNYEARGGFRAFANEWGYCMQETPEPEAKLATEEDIKLKACSPPIDPSAAL